jgi:lipopolysaccharide/colanic/teichoic acid biosynthesis glycosyltransferase
MAKRLFDILLASIGLIILAPLLIVIAIWIKLDSAGPIFFRQERVGQFGKTFLIHKFRTMVIEAEKQGLQLTTEGDKRITKSGQFLRKYKIDELPQLIDVLQGNMSLVGPRPEVPKYVAIYPEDIKREVLSVKPGITDFASIEFKDENRLLAQSEDPESTYINKILPTKLAYYKYYVEKQSIWLDTVLIYRTLKAIVGGKG